MKKILACGAAALALMASGSGWAQANPEADKLAKELLGIVKFKEMSSMRVKQYGKNMPMVLMQSTGQALEKNTKLTVDQKRAAMAKAEKEVTAAATPLEASLNDPKLADDMEKEAVAILVKSLKLDEMKQILAFYKTPAGSKMLTVVPQALGEAGQAAEKLVNAKVGKQIEKFVTDHSN